MSLKDQTNYKILALIENDYGVNFPFPTFLIETKISRG